nr:XdhC family protein [Saprospiraceae bacterium]
TLTCQSGGTVDLYLEPVLPKPHLWIFGRSHIGLAVTKLAMAMDYQTSVVVTSPDKSEYPEDADLIALDDFSVEEMPASAYVIVCTQGENDETALARALHGKSAYISFVASKRKATSLFAELRKSGYAADHLRRIKTPAGLDINAKLPEEVAISILAEIVQHLRQVPIDSSEKDDIAVLGNIEDYYINPVCDVPVHKKSAKHVLMHQGEKVYFCCDGCKIKFEAEPMHYL